MGIDRVGGQWCDADPVHHHMVSLAFYQHSALPPNLARICIECCLIGQILALSCILACYSYDLAPFWMVRQASVLYFVLFCAALVQL